MQLLAPGLTPATTTTEQVALMAWLLATVPTGAARNALATIADIADIDTVELGDNATVGHRNLAMWDTLSSNYKVACPDDIPDETVVVNGSSQMNIIDVGALSAKTVVARMSQGVLSCFVPRCGEQA